MQNVRPTDLPFVSDHLSPVSAVIDRVVAIAPAPLLPGEQDTDAEVALRIVKAAHPRDANARRHAVASESYKSNQMRDNNICS
jgi:hypothetical protein